MIARPRRVRRARASLDLLVVVALAGAAVGAAVGSVDVVAVRALLTIPLVVALPGYAICAAVGGRRLRSGEGVVFAVGTSLATAALTGLVLDLLPRGLTTTSWAVGLGTVTLVASLAALVRRDGESDVAVQRQKLVLHRLGWQDGVLFGLAAVALAGAIVVARAGALHQREQVMFTQLSILPVGHGRRAVTVRVENHEQTRMRYRLVITEGPLPLSESPVTVPDGQTWQATVQVPQLGDATQIRANLYRAGRGDIYRHVDLPVAAVS